MNIYALIASLPTLSLDTPPAISGEKFLQACESGLAAEDSAAARALLNGVPPPESACRGFIGRWRDVDTQIRNAVAVRRATKLGLDASAWVRPTQGCAVWLRDGVEDAFQEKDPLDREKAIDRLRWQALEELQGVDPMTRDAVFAYAAKLALVSKWHRYSETQGSEKLAALTNVPITLD